MNTVIFSNSPLASSNSIIVPYIANTDSHTKESFVVIDPEGNVYDAFVACSCAADYTIRRLDFQDPAQSDRWDALTSVLSHDATSDTFGIIARSLLENAVGAKATYSQEDEDLVYHTLVAVIQAVTAWGQDANLLSVYQWFLKPFPVLDAFLFSASNDPTATSVGIYASSPLPARRHAAETTRHLLMENGNYLSTGASLLWDGNIDTQLPGQQLCAYFIRPTRKSRPFISLFLLDVLTALLQDNSPTGDWTLPKRTTIAVDARTADSIIDFIPYRPSCETEGEYAACRVQGIPG